MTTLNSLVGAIASFVKPASPKLPTDDVVAPQVRMAVDARVAATPAVGKSDPGLAVAVERLDARIKAVQTDLRAIDAELGAGATSQTIQEMSIVQRQMQDDLKRLETFKRLGQQASVTPGATPFSTQRIARILTEVGQGNLTIGRLAELNVEAADAVRNIGRAVPSDRGLFQGTRKLAAHIAAIDTDMKALGDEVRNGNCSSQRLQEIQLVLSGMNDERLKLAGIKLQADRLASTPSASADAIQRMTAVVTEAAGNSTVARDVELGQVAEDIARNAGRKEPSDRGLYQGTRLVNKQICDIEIKLQALCNEVRGGNIASDRLQQIQIEMQDLQMDKKTLLNIKQQADTVASKPDASAEVVAKMTEVLADAGQGNITAQFLAELSTKAEDLARQATKKGPTDLGLYNATRRLTVRAGEVDANIKALTFELRGGNVSSQRLQELQIVLQDLQRDKAQLGALKAAADKLADKTGVSDDDVTRMKGLLFEVSTGNVSPSRVSRVIIEAEDVARNAGRQQPTSRTLAAGIRLLADRAGSVDQEMKALINEVANNNVTSQRLQEIQLTLQDLSRDRDTLDQLGAQAGRVADHSSSLNQEDQMAALIREAGQGTSSQRLAEILLIAKGL